MSYHRPTFRTWFDSSVGAGADRRVAVGAGDGADADGPRRLRRITPSPSTRPRPRPGYPELRWTAVEGATPTHPVRQQRGLCSPFEFTTANTSYTPLDATKFADGTWYWRVKVDKPTALVSEYSAPRSFAKQWAVDENKPVLLDPPHDPLGEQPIAFSRAPPFPGSRSSAPPPTDCR